MAARRKARALEAQLAFEALTIEGALLSPEWLSKISQLNAAHQSEAHYRVPKGLALRDEIGRFWRIAQAHWTDFRSGLEKQADPQALCERFVLGLLREALGFASLAKAEPVQIGDRSYPIGHRALEGRVPVVIAAAATGLDSVSPAFGDDSRRRSAFGLAQEVLNADERALWGLATDGMTLRLCRDNASLTRPAWIEADLGRIFAEERYADFAALWLLVHETRFGAPGQAVTDCPLETWRLAGHEEGTRARDKLRDGVEDALIALGRGFLAHPDNQSLRVALHGGQLTRDAYFQQLLRLVYRVIFLLTAEERGVLHPPDASEPARALYEKGYGLRRLRDRAAKRSAHDRFADLWEGLKITFRGVATGEPRLALPALGGLFAADQCRALDTSKLENRWLLAAVFKLSWLREDSGLTRVNWRDMGPEELGSVYESLLELVPLIPQDERGFSFASADESKGNARKTTGSYYTPESLVQVLLDSALEPVIQATVASHPEDPAEALLKLAVVDPACGSGHFLLAAARHLAIHVARFQVNGTPSAEQYRHAVRQVVSRCLFGVDLNPMAVELCRVSLWMEAVEPGRPLSFLDSHVQRGNALLGATPDLMKKGVPDAAFDPIEGDDKKTATLLKKRNKEVSEKQGLFDTLWSKQAASETDQVTRAVAELDAASDADLAAVAGKEARWEELQASDVFRHQRFVADAWCAAFVWPKPELESVAGGKQKKASPIVEAAPTNALWLQIGSGKGTPPPLTVKTVDELVAQYHFFHWHLAFPQVFARGGFDVVLGNPPWDASDLMKVEFFAALLPSVASARTTEDRLAVIERATAADARLDEAWQQAQRANAGESHLTKTTGVYPLTSGGKLNTYRTFAELASRIVHPEGRVGLVLKSGIVNAQDNQAFFASLLEHERVVAVRDFINTQGIFPDVVANERFCSFVITGASSRVKPATFMFCLESVAQLADDRRRIAFTLDELAALNPNDISVPPLTSSRDKDLLVGIHRRISVLIDERASKNRHGVHYARGHLNSSTDSGLFSSNDFESLSARSLVDSEGRWEATVRPLIEGKLIGSWNHRFGTFHGVPRATRFGKKAEAREPTLKELRDPAFRNLPRFWLGSDDADRIIAAKGGSGLGWSLAFRHVCRAVVDARTAQVCIVPREPTSDSCALIVFDTSASAAAVSASLIVAAWTSFIGDFVLRQKIYGPALTKAIALQLPAPTLSDLASLGGSVVTLDFVLLRVLELAYTAWDLAPFAKDAGYQGPPFRFDPDRRFLLRSELDAAFFHLYGISRGDADYILDTFPIVRKNDEKTHGEYRTKRVILEVYDAMADAIRTGKPYGTRLDPPPADPQVAHPARRSKAVRA